MSLIDNTYIFLKLYSKYDFLYKISLNLITYIFGSIKVSYLFRHK